MKGEAEVSPEPGKSFDPVLIPKAIEDAGFTASEVLVTADGTLVERGGSLALQVPGLKHSFALRGGAWEEALQKRQDLLGKSIRLSGRLHSGDDGRPEALSVEEFTTTNPFGQDAAAERGPFASSSFRK